jgi:hypothetical protein
MSTQTTTNYKAGLAHRMPHGVSRRNSIDTPNERDLRFAKENLSRVQAGLKANNDKQPI